MFLFSKHVLTKLLLLVIIPISLWPQNFAGAGFGGSDFHILDEHASALIFSSIGVAPTVQFIHIGEQGISNLELSYYNNYLSTSQSNFNTESWRARIQYSYLIEVASPEIIGKAVNLYIGGSVGTFFSRGDYYYYYKPDNGNAFADVSWIWSHSINLSAGAYYNLSKREFISAQVDIPLLSNVSRPEYSASGDYNYSQNTWKIKMFGTTEFFPKNFSLYFRLNYQHPLIGNFNMLLGYDFYYSFYNKPSDIRMYMNNFRGGLFYCF